MPADQTSCPNCFQISYKAQTCSKCGYAEADCQQKPGTLPMGTLLNQKYITGKILGIGGFGITYLAKHTDSGRLFAIKEYYPTSWVTRNERNEVIPLSQDKCDMYRYGLRAFQNEAELLASFSDEPLIVKVYHSFLENNTAYFVMEFLDGTNLRKLLQKNSYGIPYNTAIEMLLNTLVVLKKVHKENLLHRDISPENIFITKTGQIKLIDFGAARYVSSEISHSLSVILKPGFAPPEQYSSRGNQGPWTDIYALAATFYTVLSGHAIPAASDRLSENIVIPKLTEKFVDMPPDISNAIDIALKLNYKERYQSADEFLTAIQPKIQPIPKSASVKIAKVQDPYLEIVSGVFAGNKWSIPANKEILIGRSTGKCNIILDDLSISREHCFIRYESENLCFYIQDVSANGTYHPDGRLYANNAYEVLNPEGHFYLSNINFMFKAGVDE